MADIAATRRGAGAQWRERGVMMANNVRRYILSIEIEVRPQDDFAHFQPDSVVGSAPQLGIEWVSGNDAEALRGLFDFFMRLPIPDGMSIAEYSESPQLSNRLDGINSIIQQALQAAENEAH